MEAVSAPTCGRRERNSRADTTSSFQTRGDQQGSYELVLLVWQRGEMLTIPPLLQMQGLGPSEQSGVEEHRERVRSGTPTHPSVNLLFKTKSNPCSLDLPSRDQGRGGWSLCQWRPRRRKERRAGPPRSKDALFLSFVLSYSSLADWGRGE